MDFAAALDQFMTDNKLSNAALGEKLVPAVTYSAVRKWRVGEAEPRRDHRRQLIDMSGGKITMEHFT